MKVKTIPVSKYKARANFERIKASTLHSLILPVWPLKVIELTTWGEEDVNQISLSTTIYRVVNIMGSLEEAFVFFLIELNCRAVTFLNY